MSAPMQILGGRYEVGELIGRGGMAEVHKGHDTRLGRPVAIKLLRSELARDATFLTRFKREAQSAAGLNHASIVAVYDSGDEIITESGGAQHDVPYIVMEYVSGKTLRQVLTEDGPMSGKEAARVTEGVLDALSYSHRMGIVHRDIKPANVMIADDGSVKVMDFGIARAVADTSATMTQTQAVMGTAQYLSPEQAQGQTVDARSDLYSTGCMLFELLTGRAPFTGESPVAIAYQHVGEKPPLASDFAPSEISPELDAVVLHALAKRRDDRYQDATSFRADLQSARMGRSVSAAAWTGLEAYRRASGSPVTERNGATAAAAAAAKDDSSAPTEVYSTVTGAPRRSEQQTQVVPATVPAPQARPVAYRTTNTTSFAPVGREEERRRGGLGWLWGVLAALILAGIGWFALANFLDTEEEPSPQLISVPGVVGETYDEAEAILRDEGLEVERVEAASDEPEETVTAQNPIEGVEVEEGHVVILTVSTGPGQVEVPDLSGMTETQARTALVQRNLTYGEVTEVDDSDEDKGVIVGQNPTARTMVDPESPVNVQISSGMVTVPNVIGYTQAQAQSTLSDHGLLYNVSYRESTEVEEGSVFSQEPRSGLVERGTRIQLIVAQAPTPTQEPTTEEPPVEPTEEPPSVEPTDEPPPTDAGQGG
ncbi:MAG: Stk1 family PASTA domain-containing Ser/Thr kinase [Intrasporangiaceae bacterium]|nr:Stk1 family PASTA domain-containing Ser/Thr kinase [Intrasporangiaceae bacterium]